MSQSTKTSIQYSERGQQILEHMSRNGLFPNKLAALQMAGIIGMANQMIAHEFKSFKSYEITRLDDIGAIEELVKYLYQEQCTIDHPLALFERFADAGLSWLEENVKEPESFSFADLLQDLREKLDQRLLSVTMAKGPKVGVIG